MYFTTPVGDPWLLLLPGSVPLVETGKTYQNSQAVNTCIFYQMTLALVLSIFSSSLMLSPLQRQGRGVRISWYNPVVIERSCGVASPICPAYQALLA